MIASQIAEYGWYNGVFSIKKGLPFGLYKEYLETIKWKWIPELDWKNIPLTGSFILRVKNKKYSHLSCIRNGVLLDTFDCRHWNLIGYFAKKQP